MKRKIYMQIVGLVMLCVLAGCAGKKASNVTTEVTDIEAEDAQDNIAAADIEEGTEEAAALDLADGNYMVLFDTDSSMFHVNEVMEGKALLTVTKGTGVVHLIMPSQNILHLYCGLAEEAQKNQAEWIDPTIEAVEYGDGMSEEVYAFDVPVAVLEEAFDLALIGKKNVWYDHKVSLSNPEPVSVSGAAKDGIDNAAEATGEETIGVLLEGGTGKVSLLSPTAIRTEGEGYIVTLEWSSKHYDYMLVEDVKYLPVEVNEHSIFEIPVKDIHKPLQVIADTVAMSTPHEIAYTITFETDVMK